ncbi:hypothetical protein NEOLEDRAFT_868774 [Neolentinus lepideus HHB14362 ss-1]|uniref:Uncharacterized protein n=1 Tax=Neolentinus lepideus HHB14362 ss-1 TaxID=1314782 RepID=A0A165P366_9AGAM|nr:hypothetical protein NEOLEDRAFT_868774 [Neolentinus lepideus HHB14362 ss-1]
MTSAFAQTYGKKLFQKHLEQYQPADPLYEYYTNDRGKQKRRKRATPPGLTHRDQRVLKSVQRRAHYLDKGFSVCGMRFGWTFLIGIVPGAGDVADAVLNYVLVVRKARQAEIPDWLLTRMLMNNAVSMGMGFVPIAGDVFLAAFKANSRNAALLEEFLRIRADEFMKLKAEREGQTLTGQRLTDKDRKAIKPGAGDEGAVAQAQVQATRKGKEATRSRKQPKATQGRFVEEVDNGASPPRTSQPMPCEGPVTVERKKNWWRK